MSCAPCAPTMPDGRATAHRILTKFHFIKTWTKIIQFFVSVSGLPEGLFVQLQHMVCVCVNVRAFLSMKGVPLPINFTIYSVCARTVPNRPMNKCARIELTNCFHWRQIGSFNNWKSRTQTGSQRAPKIDNSTSSCCYRLDGVWTKQKMSKPAKWCVRTAHTSFSLSSTIWKFRVVVGRSTTSDATAYGSEIRINWDVINICCTRFTAAVAAHRIRFVSAVFTVPRTIIIA